MNVPLNIDWQQILLHLFNFAILAGGLYLLLYKPVKGFMQQREEYYQGLDKDARSRLQHAEQLEADHEDRLKRAAEEIAANKNRALFALEEVRRQKTQEAEECARKIIDDARQEAEYERAKILGQAQQEVIDMVAVATEKLLLQTTAAEAFEQFLTLAERGEGHG